MFVLNRTFTLQDHRASLIKWALIQQQIANIETSCHLTFLLSKATVLVTFWYSPNFWPLDIYPINKIIIYAWLYTTLTSSFFLKNNHYACAHYFTVNCCGLLDLLNEKLQFKKAGIEIFAWKRHSNFAH